MVTAELNCQMVGNAPHAGSHYRRIMAGRAHGGWRGHAAVLSPG